jgi:AcrR family transcriptional regulator
MKAKNRNKKPVGRPQGKSIDTRRRALDLAEQLLRDLGHIGTSMEAVAQRVGITKGSLYHHFPGGKDELILAVGHQMIDRERAGIDAAIDSATTAIDRLAALARWKLSESSHPEHMLRDARRFLPEANVLVIEQRFMTELFGRVQGVLEQGIKRNELEAHDTSFVAWVFLSLISQFAATPESVRDTDIAQKLAQFTLKGAGLKRAARR